MGKLFAKGQFGVRDPKLLQRALWWVLSLHFPVRPEKKAESCVGVMLAWSMNQKQILNILCGSGTEAAKHAPGKMVFIKEHLNRKRTKQ